MKKLWWLLLPATFWGITIFHKLFGLSINIGEAWYAYPLFITYVGIIVLSIYIVVIKVID